MVSSLDCITKRNNKVQRQPNFELLRGVLMLMIVFVHMTGNGVLQSANPIPFTEPNWICANIIDAICYPAVNTFIIISGYFGLRLSLSRVIKLDIPVILYGVLLYVVFDRSSFIYLVRAFMPIISRNYWFLTSYFLLLLISPCLNVYIETRTKAQLKLFLILVLLLFVIVPSCTPFCLSDPRGMDIVNFSVLYIVGRCVAIFEIDLTKARSASLYVISTVVIFLLTVLLAYMFNINRGWRSYFYAYTFILVYFQSLGLFFLFRKFEFTDAVGNFINWLSPSFFYVYIISETPIIRENLYLWVSSEDYYYSNFFVIHIICCSLLIFFVSLIIDIVLRRFLLGSCIDKVCVLIQDIAEKVYSWWLSSISRCYNKLYQ